MRETAPAAEASPAGAVDLRHDGRDRPYLLQAPPAPVEPAPLLVELHGRGIDPVSFDRMTGFRALAAEGRFVLAMPSAIGELWNDGRDARAAGGPDDVGYLIAVIDDICARLPVDPRRVYLVGMSNGATMAGRVACERADRLAAFAQVAGTAAAGIPARARPACPVPILQIHGSADRYAPYGGGVRQGLRARLVLRRASGPCIGVEDWARFWIDANRAAESPDATRLAPGITVRSWHGGSPASDVVFYRIEGGGHTWPGSHLPLPRTLFGRTSHAFDGSRAIWEFLARHARAG